MLGQPGLASCLLESQSQVILILSSEHPRRTGQNSLYHAVLWAVSAPLTLTTIPRAFEAEVFTGRKPFMSHN